MLTFGCALRSFAIAMALAGCGGGSSGDAGPTPGLYGESDSFYSVPHIRANFDAFVAAGGQATLDVYRRASGADGHFVIDDAALWAADLDRYVRERQ